MVRKPEARGFGTRSLMKSIESQLGGQALFDWRSEGLVCRLSVPLAQQAEGSDTSGQPSKMMSGDTSERLSQSASI